MKTLYFEGAGCAERGEVENCRIRTAFTNNEGRKIYLEMSGFESSKNSSKAHQRYEFIGVIDHCHYITNGHDDENQNTIRSRETFEYTKTGILSFVNSLDCNFDTVVILPDLAGYRVFKDKNGYNYGDEFEHDADLTEKRGEIKKHFYDIEQAEGKQYPNFSLWVDSEDRNQLHLLRHFNGYNKHWSIRTDVEVWQESIQETKLGKYGC